MGETLELAKFLASIKFDDLDEKTVTYTKELFLDWLGSVLAGSESFPVKVLLDVATENGKSGKATSIPGRKLFTPLWAGFVNAASSHVAEMDDLHRSSILHPAAPVISAVFSYAEELEKDGRDVITAIVTGYEAGIRVGEALGTSHYQYFHTTGTAGTFGAAAGVCKLLGCDVEKMIDALGNAGTQAAGVWEFLKHGAHSKQLHTAKAAFNGALSAVLASEGFKGAKTILEGEKGFIKATSREPHMEKLLDGIGDGFKLSETSIKYFASCRHTHPALDAVYRILDKLDPSRIKEIAVYTYKNSYDLVDNPEPVNPYQAKFSLQFTIALLLTRKRITPDMFNETNLNDPTIRALMKKIKVYHAPEYTRVYPEKWASRVEVILCDGENIVSESFYPKGDPENPLTEEELIEKFKTLTSGFIGEDLMNKLVEFSLNLDKVKNMKDFKTILGLS